VSKRTAKGAAREAAPDAPDAACIPAGTAPNTGGATSPEDGADLEMVVAQLRIQIGDMKAELERRDELDDIGEAENRAAVTRAAELAEALTAERVKLGDARAVIDLLRAESSEAKDRAADYSRDLETAAEAFRALADERDGLVERTADLEAIVESGNADTDELWTFLSEQTTADVSAHGGSAPAAAVATLQQYQEHLIEAGKTIASKAALLAEARQRIDVFESLEREGKLGAAAYIREGLRHRQRGDKLEAVVLKLLELLEQIEATAVELREPLPVGVPADRTFQHRALSLASNRRFHAKRKDGRVILISADEQRSMLGIA